MKLSQAKEFLPFVQAAAEGKTIEYQLIGDENLGWFNGNSESEVDFFNKNQEFRWRIKPTPKLRAWKPEEVPVGALIKSNSILPTVIVYATAEYGNIKYPAYFFFTKNKWQKEPVLNHVFCGDDITSKSNYLHSIDHGKTWLPCGVEESK